MVGNRSASVGVAGLTAGVSRPRSKTATVGRSAATGVAQEREKAVPATITVKENGDLFLNKEKLDSQALLARLKEMKAADPEQKVFVNSDELSYFGDVVTVLDNIRQAGIEKVAIQTKGAASAEASVKK